MFAYRQERMAAKSHQCDPRTAIKRFNFQPESTRKSLVVASEIAQDLPVISGDAGQITEIVTRLLSNAVKYTYPGGQLTLRAFAELEELLQLEVADTG